MALYLGSTLISDILVGSTGINAVYYNGVNLFGSSNLLAALPWIQGTGTTLSIVGDHARATRIGGNPRIYKTITGLVNGQDYRLTGRIYIGTADATVRMRISTTADLPAGDIYEEITGVDLDIDHTFTATGATLHIGIVAVASTNGQYSEVDDDLSLVEA